MSNKPQERGEPDTFGYYKNDQPVVTNRAMDVIVALLLLIGGVVVVVEARRLGAGWTSDGPGAGYFPFYIGLILIAASLGVIWQSTFGRKHQPESREEVTFVTTHQLQRVLSVLLPAGVYVGAVAVLGLYVASALYIAAFMSLLGRYAWWKGVAVGVGVAVAFFLMFEVWFKVPLYKGVLDPLSFLGY